MSASSQSARTPTVANVNPQDPQFLLGLMKRIQTLEDGLRDVPDTLPPVPGVASITRRGYMDKTQVVALGTAGNNATSALTNASTAQTAAGTAQTSANTATTNAATAQTAANTAQTTANEAKTAADAASAAALTTADKNKVVNLDVSGGVDSQGWMMSRHTNNEQVWYKAFRGLNLPAAQSALVFGDIPLPVGVGNMGNISPVAQIMCNSSAHRLVASVEGTGGSTVLRVVIGTVDGGALNANASTADVFIWLWETN